MLKTGSDVFGPNSISSTLHILRAAAIVAWQRAGADAAHSSLKPQPGNTTKIFPKFHFNFLQHSTVNNQPFVYILTNWHNGYG